MMEENDTFRPVDNEEETNNNDSEIIFHDTEMPKRKYVAVRGYTKTIGKKKVRVRPHIRKK